MNIYTTTATLTFNTSVYAQEVVYLPIAPEMYFVTIGTHGPGTVSVNYEPDVDSFTLYGYSTDDVSIAGDVDVDLAVFMYDYMSEL
jgi:hypothetical protein